MCQATVARNAPSDLSLGSHVWCPGRGFIRTSGAGVGGGGGPPDGEEESKSRWEPEGGPTKGGENVQEKQERLGKGRGNLVAGGQDHKRRYISDRHAQHSQSRVDTGQRGQSPASSAKGHL